MRYYKGHIALSETRDVPVLLHVRNARAICFDQLCALLWLDLLAERPRSLRWRLARLEKAGLVTRLSGNSILPNRFSESRSRGSPFSNPVATTCSRCRAQPTRLFIPRRFHMLLKW